MTRTESNTTEIVITTAIPDGPTSVSTESLRSETSKSNDVFTYFSKIDTRIVMDLDNFETRDHSEDADEESPEEKLIRQCNKSDVTGMIPECNTEVSLFWLFESTCNLHAVCLIHRSVLEFKVQARVETKMFLCSKWRIIDFSTTNYHELDRKQYYRNCYNYHYSRWFNISLQRDFKIE